MPGDFSLLKSFSTFQIFTSVIGDPHTQLLPQLRGEKNRLKWRQSRDYSKLSGEELLEVNSKSHAYGFVSSHLSSVINVTLAVCRSASLQSSANSAAMFVAQEGILFNQLQLPHLYFYKVPSHIYISTKHKRKLYTNKNLTYQSSIWHQVTKNVCLLIY